ncbi:MAG TPA: hypothetical protein VLB85_03495 [Acidimicrobiia bacterium]|nr:hypothetical protein [Acidimicrobiia bacterium]
MSSGSHAIVKRSWAGRSAAELPVLTPAGSNAGKDARCGVTAATAHAQVATGRLEEYEPRWVVRHRFVWNRQPVLPLRHR